MHGAFSWTVRREQPVGPTQPEAGEPRIHSVLSEQKCQRRAQPRIWPGHTEDPRVDDEMQPARRARQSEGPLPRRRRQQEPPGPGFRAHDRSRQQRGQQRRTCVLAAGIGPVEAQQAAEESFVVRSFQHRHERQRPAPLPIDAVHGGSACHVRRHTWRGARLFYATATWGGRRRRFRRSFSESRRTRTGIDVARGCPRRDALGRRSCERFVPTPVARIRVLPASRRITRLQPTVS